MRFPRSSGILLHPTSLPGGHGLGDLGPSAANFLEFLSAAGQTLWQVLPLGPTGYGDSPYQTFSVFAGNPLLISLDRLVEEGWLEKSDLAGAPPNSSVAHYDSAIRFKIPLLRRAAANFLSRASQPLRAEFDAFRAAQAGWLADFTLFMALKREHDMVAWPKWPEPLRKREPQALDAARKRLAEEILAHEVIQFAFFRQWNAIRADAARRKIRLMGDIPIYAAGDSADVWSRPQFWRLLEWGEPAMMSGVPPDYFSATGQLWGNPIYDWEALAKDGYRWWLDRFRATFQMFDCVRVDHFRGFQAFWQVPAGETTAQNGEWVPGPGSRIFEAVEKELGQLAIVAENLGVITPEVEAIRERFGFPGMAILQFAFGKDPQGPSFRPHNYPRDVVAYTGTHDNDTTIGWWTSSAGTDSTRTDEDIQKERAYALDYLNSDGSEIHWSFVRALMGSVAHTVVFPAQDLLGLGSEARMNMPSTLGGNWLWRLKAGALTPEIAARLARMSRVYERVAGSVGS